MATVELSIYSVDCYWKVRILCVILTIMLMWEHFVSNVLVKLGANILNSVLMLNLIMSIMAIKERTMKL